MGQLSLFAISVDEFRDFFAAPEPLAQQLRVIAAEHRSEPVVIHRKPSLLAKVGPILKHPIESPLARISASDDPSQPTESDVEALLAGQYIPPQRLVPSWREVLVWLEARAWGTFKLTTTDAELDRVEFELVTLGLPAEFALTKLMQHNPQISLQPFQGLRVGINSYEHVVATAASLSEVISGRDSDTLAGPRSLLEFLNSYTVWCAQAAAAARPRPDVVGTFWP